MTKKELSAMTRSHKLRKGGRACEDCGGEATVSMYGGTVRYCDKCAEEQKLYIIDETELEELHDLASELNDKLDEIIDDGDTDPELEAEFEAAVEAYRAKKKEWATRLPTDDRQHAESEPLFYWE